MGDGSADESHMHDREKPPVPSIIQSLPPSLCNLGLYSGGRSGRCGGEKEMCGWSKIIIVELSSLTISVGAGGGAWFHTAVSLLWNVGTGCSDELDFGM